MVTAFVEPAQVVGFTHGAHAAMIMATGAVLAHGKRLAQVAGIRVRLRDPSRPDAAPGEAFLQVDGEPWQQHIPSSSSEDPVLVSLGREEGGSVGKRGARTF